MLLQIVIMLALGIGWWFDCEIFQKMIYDSSPKPIISCTWCGCIVITLGWSFKMGVICNWWAHFGHSGSKHSECAQFLTIAYIVDPLWRTFKMYPIFNCWVHCGQVLSVPTMYSPCAHWVYGSLSPVSASSKNTLMRASSSLVWCWGQG